MGAHQPPRLVLAVLCLMRIRMTSWLQIREAPKNHRDAKRQALIRDGFKCVVTGAYDISAENVGITEEELHRVGVASTECAHIIPYSTYFAVSPTDSAEKRYYSASVLAVLKCFGYAVDNLNGNKVHSLYNVMTMHKDMHDWFDRLKMWFEATDIKDCYRVKTTVRSYTKPPPMVTFTSTHPDTLAVPAPELLALHAACAKVAHLSGVGKYIDKFNQDIEDLDSLAPDGTSADVLYYALDGLVSQSFSGGT